MKSAERANERLKNIKRIELGIIQDPRPTVVKMETMIKSTQELCQARLAEKKAETPGSE